MILTPAANAFLEKPFTAQLTRSPLCGISFLALSYDLRRGFALRIHQFFADGANFIRGSESCNRSIGDRE
jgi:hypothetical protein